jgi:hypothetical protein
MAHLSRSTQVVEVTKRERIRCFGPPLRALSVKWGKHNGVS